MRQQLIFSLILVFSITGLTDPLMKPTSLSKDLYPNDILVGNYAKDIDKPDNYLDFGYGERVANPKQITDAINAWSLQSDKIKVVESSN